MSALELRVPPVVVVLFAALAMWSLTVLVPAASLPLPGRYAVALVLAVCGAAIALAGVVAFRRSGTTVDPRTPERSSALVTGGIYRVSRNPMYVGFLLALAGFAIALGNVAALLLLPVFVWYLDRFQIEPEERLLHRRFGDAYTAYVGRTRRWL